MTDAEREAECRDRKIQRFENEIDEIHREAILMIAICALILLSIFCFILLPQSLIRKDKIERRWNNGYHGIDGGKWKMAQAIGHKSGTSYIFKCSKCGTWYEIDGGELYLQK